MECQSWCPFSDHYEACLRPPPQFLNPTVSQDLQPDEQDQAICPVLDRFISNTQITNQIEPPEIDSYLGDFTGSLPLIAYPEDPQKPNDQDPEEESTNHTPLAGRSSRRNNDNNNAHKKMITFLNRCLSSSQKKSIKKFLELLKVKKDKQKGSRYGFILSLLNIKYILGEDHLLQAYEEFRSGVASFIQRFAYNAEMYDYLVAIMPKYILSFQEMLKGELEDSVSIIYKIDDDFKQIKYEAKGMQAVLDYQELIRDQLQETVPGQSQ